MSRSVDVIVVGAGHNGLVAAILLARSGKRVLVLEEKAVVGGAVKTERPFSKAPGLGTSTGAYLLGLMPPELVQKLGVELPLLRRDPHYFLPTTDGRYLLFGSDRAAMQQQFEGFFSKQDWEANVRLEEELGKLREDVAPTWLEEPLSIEETAEKRIRPELRQAFVDLCRGSVGAYLDRFGFKSDLVKAMYAVTDGFSGLNGSWDTPGTGMNFLVHNMCRLPGADGTWMIVKGGMGEVSRRLAEAARREGAEIETGRGVSSITLEGGVARGVVLADGSEVRASAVVVNADPFRMRELVGRGALPDGYNTRLDGWMRDGSTFKVNLALRGLPRFTCLPEDRGQYGTTIHLLPEEAGVLASIRRSYAEIGEGKLPDFPTIEWYIHTTVDPSLRDAEGHHNAALFVQWVPYELAGTTWEKEEARYVAHLLSICDRFAPGTSELVVDTFPLHPRKIEAHFGITRGHIHHIDNGYGFADRHPYATPIEGLYSASAGCHPAGSVIGAAGHNAAQRVLRDMGLGGAERREARSPTSAESPRDASNSGGGRLWEAAVERPGWAAEPERANQRSMATEKIECPTILVLFGAAGDLTWRLVLPAIYDLFLDGRLPDRAAIIGVDRAPFDDDALRERFHQGAKQFGRRGVTEDSWKAFAALIQYLPGDVKDAALYATLREAIEAKERAWGEPSQKIFYMATPPFLFAPITAQLGEAKLSQDRRRSRIVVEKPIGHDLLSARAINEALSGSFDESQIFRIDHYLGKETVQNILAFRFANPMFEPIWDRRYVEYVAITVAETLGVENRASYYEHAGALRDMVQNHLMQLLCLVAMEPPVSFQADEIRNKKLDVQRAIRPITRDQVGEVSARGQYGAGWIAGEKVAGYREEPGVAPDSPLETFAALRLFVDNWRWQGVPFYMRTGKRLHERLTEVVIQFRQVPHRTFPVGAALEWRPARLRLCIQPYEGIVMEFMAKQPGLRMLLRPVDMRFGYRESFPGPSPSAYETLLWDVMQGDATLFMRADQVEAAWQLLTPVLDVWRESVPTEFADYAAGTWGPYSAHGPLVRDGFTWPPPLKLRPAEAPEKRGGR
jgi:glucose-6-phosphate 1-dehydrogenase